MQQQQVATETSVRDIVTVILRRKWVIIVLVLTSSAYMGWKAAKAPVMYDSRGQIMIRPGERSSSMVANLEFRPWEEVINSEIAILTSEPVARRATAILARKYEEQGLPGKPSRISAARVKPDSKRNSNIVDVGYRARDPKIARESLDAVLEAYVGLHNELFELPDAHEMFDQEMMRAQRDLDILERERKDYAQKMSITDLRRQKEELISRRKILRMRRIELVQSIATKRVEIGETEQLMLEMKPGDLALTGRYSPGVGEALSSTRLELVKVKSKRREILTKYTESHPQAVALEKQTRELKDQIRSIEHGQIRMRRSELRVLEEQKEVIAQQILEVEENLAGFPEKEMTMNQYERSLGLVTNTFKELLAKEIHFKIAEVSGRDYQVVILSAASRALARNPRDPVRLSLAPALSLFLGIGLAFFMDRLDHSLKNREDTENYLALPVLSSVPEVRIRKRP
ncbi:MAG: hypothetical protein KAW17_05535 [Candidatus Eisenbacteria sp.]|nr:hypothetical protein [Candidatus Eisenbacteria bacterium]